MGAVVIDDVIDDLSAFVSVAQSARITRKSEAAMRNAADSGAVRSVRAPNGHRLLLRRDVEALVKRPRHRRMRRAVERTGDAPFERLAVKRVAR